MNTYLHLEKYVIDFSLDVLRVTHGCKIRQRSFLSKCPNGTQQSPLCCINWQLNSSSTRATPSLRDRSALLGSTPTSSGRSSPYGGYPQGGQLMNGHRYADDLEGQNDEALEGLSAKVKLLKDVSEFYLFTQMVQILNECLSIVPLALWLGLALDYNWHWERSARVDNTAQPDGK